MSFNASAMVVDCFERSWIITKDFTQHQTLTIGDLALQIEKNVPALNVTQFSSNSIVVEYENTEGLATDKVKLTQFFHFLLNGDGDSKPYGYRVGCNALLAPFPTMTGHN